MHSILEDIIKFPQEFNTWERFGSLKENFELESYFGTKKFQEILLESILARDTPKYFINKIYNEITKSQ